MQTIQMITKEQVLEKRYENSDKVPEVGDKVRSDSRTVYTVGQIGGCMSMFQNCTFNGVFVLTHPESLSLVTE